MEELEAAGVCVFCPEHFEAHHREPIAFSGEHWYVTENDYPYAGAAAHYLIVPHRHVHVVRRAARRGGGRALGDQARACTRSWSPLATATVERSGDMRLNGGSVAHLHTHFVALKASPESTVRFKVSEVGADEVRETT